jgi:hypothetical protein
MSAGIVLTVTIQGGDPGSPRHGDAVHDGGALARARPVADDSQCGNSALSVASSLGVSSSLPVVHAHDLILRQAVQRASDSRPAGRNVVGLVVDRAPPLTARTHRSPPAQPANAVIGGILGTGVAHGEIGRRVRCR